MCISIFFLGSFFLCFRCMHELPSVRSQGTLIQLNILIMHILCLARLVLVQLASMFNLCRFLFTKNTDKVCMFCLDFVPLAFVFYCIWNVCSFFLTVESTLEKTTFSFWTWLRLSVSLVNCSRIKWIRVREFVCVRILSNLGYFSEQVPIAHNKEREQCVSLFHIVSHEFIKGKPESKGAKST